jgi:shikimate dehydrogenase
MGVPYAEVIGDLIARSKSPLIHGFWLRSLKLEREYRSAQVGSDGLRAHLAERRGDPHWLGCNLTMPLKTAVLDSVDRVDPLAAQVGAANIVVREGSELVAYNSDVEGFIEPAAGLLWRRSPGGAAIVGTGGAARAVLVGLSRLDVGPMVVLARRPQAARAMLEAIGVAADIAPIEDDSLDGLSILVNATPAGMDGFGPLTLDPRRLNQDEPLVYDLVYSPEETPLLSRAKALPLAYAMNGLGMLVAQAAQSFRRFFDAEAPRNLDGMLSRQIVQ